MDLVRAHCEMLTGGSKTAFPMFKKFETQYRTTPSWDRAMSVLFSYYQNKPETYDKAADALLQIYDKMPDTAKGRHTLVMLGVFYHCKGRYGEAVKTFELCLEKCPEYAKSVTDYLAEAKNRQAAQ
ncbi:MAG: hypothetical protein GX615_09605 [Lentisphaerae bacterium]|nr:hypothetical protein [Lentisphaerota bacterium]